MIELLRFPSAESHCLEIDAWLSGDPPELYALARPWFTRMRECGPDVLELMHDGCPTACVGDAAFGYVNVFTRHVNVGFFLGSMLDDPAGLLQGTGKRMRHVKLFPGEPVDAVALEALIQQGYEKVRELA